MISGPALRHQLGPRSKGLLLTPRRSNSRGLTMDKWFQRTTFKSMPIRLLNRARVLTAREIQEQCWLLASRHEDAFGLPALVSRRSRELMSCLCEPPWKPSTRRIEASEVSVTNCSILKRRKRRSYMVIVGKKTRRTSIRELLAAATTNEVSGMRCYRFAFYGEHNIRPGPHFHLTFEAYNLGRL